MLARHTAARVTIARLNNAAPFLTPHDPRSCCPLSMSEGCAGDHRVGHEVESQCGDVGRSDDTADGQRASRLLAAYVQLIAEECRRQGCVDESGGDDVDADRRKLEGEVARQGREVRR
jgi:hypothetical protein